MGFFDGAGKTFGKVAAAGAVPGLLDMFGGDYKDPTKGAMRYMDQIPEQLRKYMDPYNQAGQRALPGLENEYGNMMSNPGGRLNDIGAGYKESPGFQFALKQALQGSGNAAAAGGMAGSPQHEFQNMDIASGLASRDYNDWIKNALGLHSEGLAGEHGIYNTGAEMGGRLGEDLSSVLANQGMLKYAGAAGENAADAANRENMWKFAGSALPFLMGNPTAAMGR